MRVKIGTATLYLGDCREVLPTISAGVLITDPPYGITDAHWDRVVPTAEWMLARAAVCFAAEPYATELINTATLPFKYDLVWAKGYPTNHMNGHIRPLRAHERILVFGAPTYIPQKTQRSEREMARLSVEQRASMQWKNPDSVLFFDAIHNKSAERTMHGAQKPTDLMRFLVASYSAENEVVVDPFMGSGSTGVACASTGRAFIGIELEPDFFSLACERIDRAQRQERLFA